jgi:hypothetical protein
LKSLLCCCTFTLDNWACALRSCIEYCNANCEITEI